MPINNASTHLVKTGDRFTRLTVVSFSHHDHRHRRHYEVQCDCGKIKTVQGSLLRSGNTRSCGCLSNEARGRHRLQNDRGIINQIILQYKRHARNRSIEFHLTYPEVEKLIRAPCHYCGDPGGNVKRNKHNPSGFTYNGIDRADSTKPYTANNCLPCCGTCNIAKGTRGRAEFIAWATKIAEQWCNPIESQGLLP